MSNGLTVLYKNRAAPITKNRAYCLVVDVPTRLEPARPGSMIMVERSRHWERVTLHGRVLRCHTELEAQEAAMLIAAGIDNGDFLAVAYTPYDPGQNDISYHEWVQGETRRLSASLGVPYGDLPETQDPSLRQLSDQEWLLGGPR